METDLEEMQSQAERFVMHAAEVYTAAGQACSAQGAYDEAFRQHWMAARLHSLVHNWSSAAAQYVCMATALKERDNNEIEALVYYKKAAKRYRRANMVQVAACLYKQVGAVYQQYEHENARLYFQLARDLLSAPEATGPGAGEETPNSPCYSAPRVSDHAAERDAAVQH